MKQLLEIGLQSGGYSLILLCIGSLWIPKILGWKERVRALPPLMRELWWTYSIYIWSSHVFFSVLTLGFGDWLMSKTGPALALSIFMFLWWSVRLFLQFFGFDLSEVTKDKYNRIGKQLLTLLFIGLVTLFGGLIAWNLSWI